MIEENQPGLDPAKQEKRKSYRLLCSDLVTVHWASGRGTSRHEAAVLEDYSSTGASLSIDVRIEPGVPVTIRTSWESFGAVVRRCQWRDQGYLIGIEFDEPRIEDGSFVPDHLVDPSELGL